MTPPNEPLPAPVKPRDDLRDLRKRLEAVRVTFTGGDQVLTNADYAVLGLEPFVSDDFSTEGSGSANRVGRARTASTARTPRGRPRARRTAPARHDDDDDDDLAEEEAPEDSGPRIEAPTAADLLGSMGLGHLLSLRKPETRADSGEAVGARAERAGSGGSSSRHTTGERSGEQSRRSRAPVLVKSIAAAGANEPSESEGEVEGERESVERQHVTGHKGVGGEAGAASGSRQRETREGSSSEGGGAAAGEATVEQVVQLKALASQVTTSSPPNASADQQVQAGDSTGIGDDACEEDNGPEPPQQRKLRPRQRSSGTATVAPPASSGSGARSATASGADETVGGVDESAGGVASRLRPRKRSAAATPAARVTSAPRPPKRKKKGGQATSAKAGKDAPETGEASEAEEAHVAPTADVPQTGIKEEDPSGKAMCLFLDYEKNKAAVMKLFGDGLERAVAHKKAQHHPTRIAFGKRAVSVRYDVALRKSHANSLLRFDATSLEPHVSLAGTDDPATPANPSLGWKETSLDLFTPASVQNLKAAAFDILEGLGVFWSDKYCTWLPESVWRKYDEEKGTVDRFERTDLLRDLIDGRITLHFHFYEGTSRMVRTIVKKNGKEYQCYLPLLPAVTVEGPLLLRVKDDDYIIESEEHCGLLLSSLVGVKGAAKLRKWQEDTLCDIKKDAGTTAARAPSIADVAAVASTSSLSSAPTSPATTRPARWRLPAENASPAFSSGSAPPLHSLRQYTEPAPTAANVAHPARLYGEEPSFADARAEVEILHEPLAPGQVTNIRGGGGYKNTSILRVVPDPRDDPPSLRLPRLAELLHEACGDHYNDVKLVFIAPLPTDSRWLVCKVKFVTEEGFVDYQNNRRKVAVAIIQDHNDRIIKASLAGQTGKGPRFAPA